MYVVVGLVVVEIQFWGEGDVFGFDEVFVEGVGIVVECVDIGVEIEGVFWFYGDFEIQFVQGWQEEVVMVGEFFVMFFENGDGGWFEIGQCGLLGYVWCVDVEVLCQFFQFRYCCCWCYQLVQVLVGYVEIFGKIIQDESVVVDFQY